jgi:hypothetical protein
VTSYSPHDYTQGGSLIRSSDTGLSQPGESNISFVEVRCDNYLVSVAIDPQGRFLGVARITAAGDFLTRAAYRCSGHHMLNNSTRSTALSLQEHS